jgi:hypothetical protein
MKDVERKWMVVAFLGLIISTFLIVMSSPISDYLINTFYFAGKFK